MSSIGETLRRARVKRNLDLDQISRELKISPKLLEAIEAEQFQKLPGSMFAKSFVRQYAHFLGLDEEEMANEVARTLQPQTELPRFADTQMPVRLPIQVPKVEAWETVGDRSFSWGSPLPALALFVVAMLACSGVYAWYQRKSHPVLAQTSIATEAPPMQQQAPPVSQAAPPPPTETAAPRPAAAIAQQQLPPVTVPEVKPTPAPLTTQTVATAAPPPAPSAAPNPNATVHVQITAEEPAWVLARSDGKYLFSGTLDANQSRTLEGVKNIELRLGNAGAVNIVLNGNPIGPVGPKGQVRTVQFTSGGFQIVAAPKSAPVPEIPRL